MAEQSAGSFFTTVDAPCPTSIIGAPVRVFVVHVISAATAAVVVLRNGTSAASPAWTSFTGTISTGATFNLGNAGMLFPNGCFVDVDANTVSAVTTFNAY